MDLRQGIIETANALGMPPAQLATIISYESGFNPDVWGGKGGNYYGLIQFGPHERQQYGVRVGDPTSQLGPEGAIVRYFRDRGWKPGMSMLDAYSTVNAGSPGHYNASDAGNGGQPGSVYDKVTNQFGPHERRAAAFLGEAAGPAGPVRHPPNPTVGTGGYVQPSWKRSGGQQFGPPISASPAQQPATRGDLYAAIGKGLGAMGGMEGGGGGADYRISPQPAAVLSAEAPAPIADMQSQAVGRQQLAEMMARLNSGRLWG